MAALVAGVQYGLSSQSNFYEDKDLIFVKLTDSAHRAIEDYVRNKHGTSQNPTIQFQGNEGHLSFPSTQSGHGSAGFTFSLSGNQDIEGPQGGFECIQQTGPTSLESLGALPYKMRIQANDDVYETTRHRMAVAEENNKNKCTRVIKANGPDIGRKVKVKSTVKTIPPVSNNARYRESSNVPPSSTGGNNQLRLSSTYKSTPINNQSMTRNQPEKKISDIMRRPLKERLIHLLAVRPYKKPELYDRINKEGIKERERSSVTTILKQVAFMRDNTFHLHRYVWNDVQEDWPYYTEQDKAIMKRRKPQNLTPPGSSDGGSSGSGQSPNSVHPGSPPAITAPPPNLLNKRPGYYQGNDGLPTKKPRISHYKKPEPSSNTTSSLSSTSSKANESGRTKGSGVSGGVIAGVGGNVGGVGGGSGSGSGSAGGGSVSVSTSGNASIYDVWDQRHHHQQQQQQQQQQRERRTDYRAERTSNSEVLRSGGGNYGNGKTCPTSSSNSNSANNQNDSGISSSESNATNVNIASHNSHNSITHNNSMCNSRNHYGGSGGGGGGGGGSGQNINKSIQGGNENSIGSSVDHLARKVTNSTSGVAVGGVSASSGSNSTSGGYSASLNGIINERRDRTDRIRSDRERESRQRNNANHGSNSLSSSTTNHNLANNFDGNLAQFNDNVNDNTVTTSTCNVDSQSHTDFPNFLSCYTPIQSLEQRRRYKIEFYEDYQEYRRLHSQMAMVSERFQQLEERLKEEQATGNIEGWREVNKMILMEYEETKSDPIQEQTKRRFEYLHEKLSHIKRLVTDYDMQNSGSTLANHMGDTGGMDSTHY